MVEKSTRIRRAAEQLEQMAEDELTAREDLNRRIKALSEMILEELS